MAKKQTINDYTRRIARVSSYIAEHLDDELDMAKLAEIACFSPFHWHRIYHAMVGETAAQTVRRLRMYRAATELLKDEIDIKTVAKNAGYSSVEAFTRAFSAVYAEPPAHHRNRYEEPMMHKLSDVKIETRPALKLVTKSHIGPYHEIGKAYDQLCMWAQRRELAGPKTRYICLYFDDPSTVPADKLHSEAGFIVPNDFEPDDADFSTRDLPGGDYVILRHKGPYTSLSKSYEWLYATWLPQSGREIASPFSLEEYLNDPQSTPAAELETDIGFRLK